MFAETIKKDIMNWDGSYTQTRMHSGRTDGSYGHHDWINKCGWGFGSYHYHHTLLAHLHPNGICPYGNEKVGSIINPYTGKKIALGTSYFYEGIHYFSLNLVAKALTANDVLGTENDGNNTGVFYACATDDSMLENLGEKFTFSLPEGTIEFDRCKNCKWCKFK